jgi:hypothetical protein
LIPHRLIYTLSQPQRRMGQFLHNFIYLPKFDFKFKSRNTFGQRTHLAKGAAPFSKFFSF